MCSTIMILWMVVAIPAYQLEYLWVLVSEYKRVEIARVACRQVEVAQRRVQQDVNFGRIASYNT